MKNLFKKILNKFLLDAKFNVRPFVADLQYFSSFHAPKDEFDYDSFMSVFRDSKAVKEWQRFYLNFFDEGNNILDVGCGKGEFLELLLEKNINGVGIDINSNLIKICKAKGLNVVLEDFDAYLLNLEDNSLDGIFASHFIEHLFLEQLNRFFKLCWHKLKPGGILIMETPNPHNFASFKLFYLDPTHVRPIFPEFAKFLFASNGFGNLEVFYVDVIAKKTIRETEAKELCFDFTEYAVIGKKRLQ